jgi:hypothetical protein
MSTKPTTPKDFVITSLLDVVAPFLAYLVVQRLGIQALWALAAGGAVAGVGAAVNTVRRKGLDRVGVLVLLEIGASIVLLFTTQDPRLLLIRPSFYSAIAALYLIFTVFAGRPLSFDAAKPMAARGGPERLAAYERSWERSGEFRRIHRVVTAGFGLACAADAVLRVVVVYSFPVQQSMWLSNVPHVAAIVLIVAASALAGRAFKRLVERELADESGQRSPFSAQPQAAEAES